MRCWDDRQADPKQSAQIDLGHYKHVKTIHDALNYHADQALDELDKGQQAIAKTLLSGSEDNTLYLWDITPFQVLQDLAANHPLAAKTSEALQFLWERTLKDITFVHQPHRPSLFPIKGYHLADAAKYRDLLDPTAAGETKLDQVLRWARKSLSENPAENRDHN